MSNPVQDSPAVPSTDVIALVEAADQAIREQLAALPREDALDAIDLLRERLTRMMRRE